MDNRDFTNTVQWQPAAEQNRRALVESELAKIDAYVNEGKRLWPEHAELVLSRAFYEQWEEQFEPRPFPVLDDLLTIAETALPLAEDTDRVACAGWDEAEQCMAVCVEGGSTRQPFFVIFNDGEAQLTDGPLLFLEDDELGFGERLEIICDLIAYLRRENPGTDVRELLLSVYRETLGHIAGSYPARSIRIMKKLSRAGVDRMVAKVLEDMAGDEISEQLVLPLDGTYAAHSEPAPEPPIAPPQQHERELASRTPWSVFRELDFARRAFARLAEMNESYVIHFRSSEVLQARDASELIVKVPIDGQLPLAEGDRLRVHARGVYKPVARFRIDLNEGTHLIGTLSWRDQVTQELSELYARPRPGTALYIAQVLEALLAAFRKENSLGAPVLDEIFGIQPATVTDLDSDGDGTQLDAIQERAVANALCESNTICAVQGPPGTGKTHVLVALLTALCEDGKRVLVTAPSHAAVDNVCRRVTTLPVLRLARDRDAVAADVAENCWIQNRAAVEAFKRKRESGGSIYAGTHFGVLRDDLVQADLEQNGAYDVIIFDEAGMANLAEFMLCARLARRVVLFGDHQQLPPFPMPDEVVAGLAEEGPPNREMTDCIEMSALEWLIERRGVPACLLQWSYRCQNPRLMRFSSILFYNAQVRASEQADYYQLSFSERQAKYPRSTLRLLRTSSLPLAMRQEQLILSGGRPGLENALEANLAAAVFYDLVGRYPLHEISIISPYRCQVYRIRQLLDPAVVAHRQGSEQLDEAAWRAFLYSRVATVDSFQGGESDVVIISYVRSNDDGGIGFVDDPNRVNVAHTRCRRELVVIADMTCLAAHGRNAIYARMERAIERDGEIVDITREQVAQLDIADAQA
jgi:hypothetical protein